MFIAAFFFTMTPLLISIQWLLGKLHLPGWGVIASGYYRVLCSLLRIRVRIVGEPVRDRPVLFVSNHVSWADILAIGSIMPVAFVSKSEVANWPLVGATARLQRTVFVDRARRSQTGDAIAEMVKRLTDGVSVVLFAEGTSSDGNRVLPFRSALLGGLRDAMEENGLGFVQPVSIAYRKFHGIPMGRQYREVAAWYGDTDLVPHVVRVLREGAIDVTVSFGQVMEVAHADDRKALSRKLEIAVRRLTSLTLAGRIELLTEVVSLAGERR